MRHVGFVAMATVGLGVIGAPESQSRQIQSCPSASHGEIVARAVLPGRAGYPLLANNKLWITITRHDATGDRPALARVNERSGAVERIYPLPGDPMRMAYGFGALWITTEGTLLRVDVRTGAVVRVIRGPRLFGPAVTTTSDAVWVGGADVYPAGHGERTLMRWLYKIDPTRNVVVRQVYLASTTALDLIGDRASVWVSGWGAVVKLSSAGRVLFEQRFVGAGWALGRSPGVVWVAEPFAGRRNTAQTRTRRLMRITTSGPRRLTVVALEAQPGDLSVSAGVVWVGPFVGTDGSLTRLDGTETTPAPVPVSADVVPTRIEAFPGGAWVVQRNTNQVIRLC